MTAAHFGAAVDRFLLMDQKFTRALADRCNGASVPDLFVLDKPGPPV
jgi:hypothetical protein